MRRSGYVRTISGRAALLTGLVFAAGLQPASAEELMDYSGKELFQRFCASCHGAEGRGDGPVAPFFKLAVPDITRIANRRGGPFPADDVRRIIDGRSATGAHGARSMPVWGWEFRAADSEDATRDQAAADELIARLVEYLRSLQVK